MKKIALSLIALMAITASSVFGMYGPNNDWIDFLTHGNQFRARIDQLGFTLGNGTLKGTFGFRGHNVIFTDDGATFRLNPTVSAGIGYTSEVIGVGVGYNFTYITKNLFVHTPVLALNFLNNNLRLVVPVQIAMSDKLSVAKKYTGISMDPQVRYYTGLEYLPEIRVTVKYGQNDVELKEAIEDGATKFSANSVGVDARIYFGANVEDVSLTPFLKVTYDTLLNAKGKERLNLDLQGGELYAITAASGYALAKSSIGAYDRDPYLVRALPTLGLSTSSDIVTIYVEAGLGYAALEDGYSGTKLHHALAWSTYGEIYLTPMPNLEWYFELEANGLSDAIKVPEVNNADMIFNATTGITWYLPSLGADNQ